MAKKYYAVREGREKGIFTSWDECRSKVTGYSGAVYKSFESIADAKKYLKADDAQTVKPYADKKTESDVSRAAAYVDGSYNITNGHFSYGAVIMYKGSEYKLSREFDDGELASMRNVAGEIKGAEAAMRFCIDNGIPAVDIYHDYEGIAKWCSGEWKTNKAGTKKYAEFFSEISDKVDVRFIKVKGHSGDKYNDMADALAKEALGI